MTQQYDNEKKGVLFDNAKGKQKNQKAPDFSGEIMLKGRLYDLAAWWRQSSKTGDYFLSVKLGDPKQPKQGAPQAAPPMPTPPAPPAPPAPTRPAPPPPMDYDDDVPFS